jgi:hypothetical protein
MIDRTDLLLKQHLYTVVGERDPQRRRAAISTIWNREGTLISRPGVFVGLAAIDRAIQMMQSEFPGFVCSELGSPDFFHGIGRAAWGYGLPNFPPAITGMNVAVVSNHRLTALYIFVDDEDQQFPIWV